MILREGIRQYRAYRRFASLSDEERAKSEIPQQFASALPRLGPTFIKLGQILSTRPDILPMEDAHAIEFLQERVPPFSFEEARALVKADLGKDLPELFSSFEEVPVASASLAQVHFAVLPDGTEVAVKVQRPDIRLRIEDDLNALDSLLRWKTFSGEPKQRIGEPNALGTPDKTDGRQEELAYAQE